MKDFFNFESIKDFTITTFIVISHSLALLLLITIAAIYRSYLGVKNFLLK